MNSSFFKEVLDSGWSSLRDECKKSSNGQAFNKQCSLKLLDSRDADFNQIENRIAYTYKFGNSIMILVETCISVFFKQCSDEEIIHFLNNVEICSLSNGPGLDIIGYLSALMRCNKHLNYCPILKCINLYDSWQDLFQRAASVAHEYCAASYVSCDQNPSKIIQFIQCDIYSTLSHEARECIANSDILLMCKVFSSTKANPEIVTNTIKEILILLKPGSIIFFIASKRNIKNVSTLSFLNEFAKIKLGPLKVTPEYVPLNADVPEAANLKVEQSDKSYFMVLQKFMKHQDLNTSVSKILENPKKRARRRKKKMILTPSVSSCDISVTDNSKIEDTDLDSSMSVASSYKQFDTTSDESKSVSDENVSQIGVTHITLDSIDKRGEHPENLPHSIFQRKLQAFLNQNNNIEHSCNVDEHVVSEEDILNPFLENAVKEYDEKLKSDFNRNINVKNVSQNASTDVLIEISASPSNSKGDLSKIHSNDALSSVLTKSVAEKFCNSNVESEKLIKLKHLNIKEPANEMVSTFPLSSPLKYIPPHKKCTKEKIFNKSTFDMESVDVTDCLERKRDIESEINLENRSRKSLQEISTQIDRSNINLFQVLKKNRDCCEERKQEKSTDSSKSLFSDTTHLTTINSAPSSEKELKTKTGTKQKETKNIPSVNLFHVAGNNTRIKEFIDTRNRDSFHSIIERCENLVTSLEGLVQNISKNMDLINDQSCCKAESYTNCRHLCACSTYCYEQSFLRNNCCCKRIKNHVPAECLKSVCSRTCDHQMHTCNYDMDNSRNSRQPYLALPIQSEDISVILNLVSKNS